MNTLIQQFQGRITSPKLHKKTHEGKWEIIVRIEYRSDEEIESNDKGQIIEKTILHLNTKEAEEQGYMEAICELYYRNPDLYEKMFWIKRAKSIKTPEKKVKILRNITFDCLGDPLLIK